MFGLKEKPHPGRVILIIKTVIIFTFRNFSFAHFGHHQNLVI